MLLEHLKDYKNKRDKISRLISSGQIHRIKKGLYILGPDYKKKYNHFILAGMIYGPSYISLHSALSYWGAIPEKVSLTTCITTKRKKYYSTPVGDFSYKHLSPINYQSGILSLTCDNTNILMAGKEKALSDSIFFEKLIRSKEDIFFFFKNMRIDTQFLLSLNLEKLSAISKTFNNKRIQLLLSTLEENYVK